MSLEAGSIIGDYEVIGVLGAGGMGSVYRVRNLISDRVDAMKVLLPDLTSSADLAERFLKEIKVLASFGHPNIAALHTALRIDNRLLMIMELVDGTNLEERTRAGALPVPEAVSYASQILAALSYAHARGVVHRDIKPANIAIDSEGRVKLLDFGIARAEADRRLTRTGMVLGSLYYMSPEQVNGQSADTRSDLYSVGGTLYKAVTGQRPIDGDSEFAVMRAQVSHVPAPPHQLDSRIPQSLSDVILRSLAKAPHQRFQTAEEFRRALEPFLSSTYAVPNVTALPQPRTGVQETLTVATPIPSSTVFHSDALTALQRNLAQWLGPIAGAVVRQQVRTAASLPELCRLLANQIPAEADRQAFLSSCARQLGADAVGEASAPASRPTSNLAQPPLAVAWDPALLERSKKHLAGFIGPLAKVMVDRAARKAHSVEELYSILGAEIPSAKDRELFLASASRERP